MQQPEFNYEPHHEILDQPDSLKDNEVTWGTVIYLQCLTNPDKYCKFYMPLKIISFCNSKL